MEPFSAESGRTVARLARQVEVALVGVDITPAQYRILALLSEGSAAATALAGRLAVSRPAVTALVDGLVQRDLVVRGGDPEDRRRVTHGLTASGRRVLAKADAAVAARLGEIARHGTGDDAADAATGLEAWHRSLDAYRAAKVGG